MATNNEFPKTLAGFGYGFNYGKKLSLYRFVINYSYFTFFELGDHFSQTAGKIRKIDPETGVTTDTPFEFNVSENPDKNQRHYEALGEVLNEHVYQLLIDEGLQKIHIPSHLHPDQATFVFSNRADFRDSKKLIVLINGSGVVRAGQWSRR